MDDKQHRIQALEKELAAQRLLNWQLIAADGAGIPLAHASRLRGKDLDELREDALVFAKQIGARSRRGSRRPGRGVVAPMGAGGGEEKTSEFVGFSNIRREKII